MKKFLTIIGILCLGWSSILAQTVQVSGTVTGADDGQPLPGVSVVVKGTIQGTVTDVNGRYSISVPADGALQFSFVGMTTQNVAVGGRQVIDVEMQADAQAIDEVIITGYGTFTRKAFTGSASTIGQDDVKDTPSETLQSRLAGAIAGVKVSANAGQPGGFTSMRIRGSGSINASNNPLYVIDGVPIYTGDISEFTYAASGTDPTAMINPSDIESITVIKDAASASLYGSRAANGVILITTKKGKAGKPIVTAKADWGSSDFAIDWRPVWDGDTRNELQKHALVNYYTAYPQTGSTPEQSAEAALAGSQKNYAAKPETGWVNWRDLLMRKNAMHSNYEFNIKGGDEKTKFLASLGYTDHQGLSIQSGYERYTGRVGVNHKSDRWLLDANVFLTKATQERSNEGTSFASPIMAVFGIGASPAFYPFDKDGSYIIRNSPSPLSATSNPLASAVYNCNTANLFRTLSSFKAGYRLWDNLILSERLSYDKLNNKEFVWWDSRTGDGLNYNGLGQIISTEHETLSTQTQLSYQKSFSGGHNVDAVAAFETEGTNYTSQYLMGYDFPTATLREFAQAAETAAETEREEVRLMSFLGSINYSYSDKYYMSASFREDGTSRLSSKKRWGGFWSLSGAWRLSNESFYPIGLKDILDDAKIRLSYGMNGNLPSNWYAYQGVFTYGWKYAGIVGSAEDSILNEDLGWEKNYITNLGLDLNFINRISVTLDLYNRETKDLLYQVPISQTTGFINTWTNVALVNNKGIELEIRSNNIVRNDFKWITSFNIAYNKNTIKKLGTSEPVIDGLTIMEEGKPLYSIYAWEYAGVDPQTGSESFYVNKEGKEREKTIVRADADRINLGSVTPPTTGGITNSFFYKGIDFSFVMTYSLGGKVYDNATWMQTNGGGYCFTSNMPTYYVMKDMWKQPGDDAKLPKFQYGNANNNSSRWLYSTDHLRLKSITLGYSLPSQIINKAGIGKCRVYFSANNWLTLKNKDLYLDPETPINGLVVFQTPPLKTVTFGVEFEF